MVIPKTWYDQAIATLEVPLADPISSPKREHDDRQLSMRVMELGDIA
jgi:hypothetical protein